MCLTEKVHSNNYFLLDKIHKRYSHKNLEILKLMKMKIMHRSSGLSFRSYVAGLSGKVAIYLSHKSKAVLYM